MNDESYAEMLGQLADALKPWVDKLSIELNNESKFDRWFGVCIDDARLKLLVRLGAERRGYLAELIDTTLNQVKEQGKKFTGATGRSVVIRAEQGVPLLEFNSVEEMSKSGSHGALEDMREQMHKCDQLFAAIDHAIRQADSPSSDEGGSYENRFGYLSNEICDELGISSKTLNKYAKQAGVATPDQGERNFLYSPSDYEKTLRKIAINCSDTAIRKVARVRLAEIESKSKDQANSEGENPKAYRSRIKKSETKSKDGK